MPGCVIGATICDLTASVEDWAGETPEKAALL
jgi:hypothetical protein